MKKKKTENVDSKVSKTKDDRAMILSLLYVASKVSRFMKEEKAKGILSSLRLKTLLSNIPLFGDTLF